VINLLSSGFDVGSDSSATQALERFLQTPVTPYPIKIISAARVHTCTTARLMVCSREVGLCDPKLVVGSAHGAHNAIFDC
jgi:hypothetical protein